MSAGLSSTVANYGGKISNPTTIIKQFIIDSNSYATWNYLKSNSLVKTIVPTDKNSNVLIYKNLIVEGAIINPSDERLKENIEELSLSSSKIDHLLNLKPVKYNLKSDKNKQTHFGLVAQDVEQIYPELVHHDNKQYKSLNYIEFIPILIEKMKKMQEQIDTLNKRVENLEGK